MAIIALSFIAHLFDKGDKKADAATPSSTSSTATPSKPASAWSYSEDTDKMTSKVVYHAYVGANEGLKLQFPYEGSEAYLNVRSSNGSNDVYLHVTKGQLLGAEVDGGHTIQVRFDDDKAMNFAVVGPSDMSSETVYITDAGSAKFLSRLKTAKKVLIGAEFYDNGTQQMEFNTAGIDWTH